MKKGPRYPLEALLAQRKSKVDERAQELASERARTTQAEARLAQATEAKRRHELEAARARSAEQTELEAGQLRAQDLARKAGWEHAAAREQNAHETRRQEAAERLTEQQTVEEAARGALRHADADAEAVDKHRGGWDAARQQARDNAEEQSAEEAWLAQRFDQARRNT